MAPMLKTYMLGFVTNNAPCIKYSKGVQEGYWPWRWQWYKWPSRRCRVMAAITTSRSRGSPAVLVVQIYIFYFFIFFYIFSYFLSNPSPIISLSCQSVRHSLAFGLYWILLKLFDLSKLWDGFFWIVTWICQNWCMDFYMLLHGFICQSC